MSSADNAEDLFPNDVIPAAPADFAAARVPEPWHKPRKHWIRKVQWVALISSLIDELHFDGRPFRYLTLPGRHFLDVRQIHAVCASKDLQLRFIGFDTSRRDEAETNISADEVWRLSHIHKASELLADRVEGLANSKSIAHERVRQCGDLDAVNLDLCDSVAGREAGASDTALEAILKIIELQSETRTAPWLLFLTTRADRGTVKRSVLTTLLNIVQDNLTNNAGFKEEVVKQGFFSEEAVSSEVSGVEAFDASEFTRVFGIGFSKWILKMSVAAWKVKQTISACYRVCPSSSAPDMLSLAFRFERQPISLGDSTGLVRPRKAVPVQQPATEEGLAVDILLRTQRWVDVDIKLHLDEPLRESIIAENADIMAEARFDRAQVLAWGRENCWQPPAN